MYTHTHTVGHAQKKTIIANKCVRVYVTWTFFRLSLLQRVIILVIIWTKYNVLLCSILSVSLVSLSVSISEQCLFSLQIYTQCTSDAVCVDVDIYLLSHLARLNLFEKKIKTRNIRDYCFSFVRRICWLSNLYGCLAKRLFFSSVRNSFGRHPYKLSTGFFFLPCYCNWGKSPLTQRMKKEACLSSNHRTSWWEFLFFSSALLSIVCTSD